MNKEQFQRELDYTASVSIATSMLRHHLITQNEFSKIKAALIERHRPMISSLHETVSGDPPRKG